MNTKIAYFPMIAIISISRFSKTYTAPSLQRQSSVFFSNGKYPKLLICKRPHCYYVFSHVYPKCRFSLFGKENNKYYKFTIIIIIFRNIKFELLHHNIIIDKALLKNV